MSHIIIHIRFFLIIKEPPPNYFALNIEKQFAATLKLKLFSFYSAPISLKR